MSANSPCKRSNYDIIIAGGGTAGCVLAARLSEVPDLHVLVLEAGQNHNENAFVKIPGMWRQAVEDRELNWSYQLAPQAEIDGRTPSVGAGKALGGSSLINVFSLLYPSRAGVDAWKELGNEGWDWDTLLPYIKKFQTFNEPSQQVAKDLQLEYVDRREQGVDGPIQVSYQRSINPLDVAWIDTFKNLGLDMKTDTISGTLCGGYSVVNTIDAKTRERSHAGTAYLAKAMHRPNLEVITGALVNRIVVTHTLDTRPRAVGIEFSCNNQSCIVNTTDAGEIIVCAGSIASPCLLERSGIGNPRILQKLGIDTLVPNDYVGENLHDHLLTGVSFQVKEGVPTLDEFRDPAKIQEAMNQYAKDGSGPLGSGSPSFAYMPLLEGQEQMATKPTGMNGHSDANGSTTHTFTNTTKIPFTSTLR